MSCAGGSDEVERYVVTDNERYSDVTFASKHNKVFWISFWHSHVPSVPEKQDATLPQNYSLTQGAANLTKVKGRRGLPV